MFTTVLFIDSRVSDYESLISQFAPGTEYYVLDSGSDGVQQILDLLAGHSGYDSLQIISHGSSGSISIGSSVLNNTNLSVYSSQLLRIGSALTANGDLLLYGCNVAQGMIGQSFVEQLATATGLDVAASNDATGGNWVLEVQTGAIDQSAIISAPDYGSLLGTQALTLSFAQRVDYTGSDGFITNADVN